MPLAETVLAPEWLVARVILSVYLFLGIWWLSWALDREQPGEAPIQPAAPDERVPG